MQETIKQEGLIYIEPGIKFDDLADNFELFDDWEDRYRYIIDLGRKLPPFPESAMTDTFKVRGCMSQVWMVPGHKPEKKDCFVFAADSDAHIVKGLIYILATLYSGKTATEIASIKAEDAFARLGLDQHLSPSRRNGFVSMVERIHAVVDTA